MEANEKTWQDVLGGLNSGYPVLMGLRKGDDLDFPF